MNIALPLYLVVLLTSFILYFSIVKTMKLPVKTGEKGLVGMFGRVVNTSDGVNIIDVHGELWSAVSKSQLSVGEIVKVTDVNDLTLTVDELNSGAKES
jgi:membrane-bound ClpP family serine protease